ncbi:type II toxin-antitoxin system YafQ family toxin [Corynebacterium hindlerae]|uniref:type II toxin-antitoxin system YafQ family toxin n=1 Tax=Corynebacterium hindlerae TaxID=699041 RepID=UPI001AD61950|nr:type II toxin-antitoxin system YafQ family toxin [Corynebacterium hindlerae]
MCSKPWTFSDAVPVSSGRKVIALILENSDEAKTELRRRHKAHALKGDWAGSFECHVANVGDWLLIWKTNNAVAVLIRTGTHEELFR